VAVAPQGETPAMGMLRLGWAAWCVVLLATLVALLGLRTIYVNDNAYSRLATVYALVNDGGWWIDRPEGQSPNPFEALTADKVEVNGRMLSSKPPLMPLLMTALYYPMHGILGLTLGESGDLKRILQIYTFLFGVLPFVLGLVAFGYTLALYTTSAWGRVAPLLALAFGTQLLGFAPQLNNHVPGVALCLGATYLGLGLYTRALAPKAWRFVAFGLLGGLTHTVDLPLTIFIAALGLALLLRFPRETVLWGGLGMLPPLAIHFGILYLNTGMPLPVQTRKELYLFENSPWRAPIGIDGLNEPKPYYAFHLLLGRHGVFLLYPVLLFGIAGAWRALWQRGEVVRGAVLVSALCVGALFAYYISSTNNYGGAAYGFRWAIGAMPYLLLMAAPLLDRTEARWPRALFAVCFVVSGYSCYECYGNPWSTDAEWTARLIFGPTS